MKKIDHIEIEKEMKVSKLIDSFGEMGHGARKISQAREIMKGMFSDSECKVFFGVAGAMVPGGMKKVILKVLDNTDVFVTTGATLTHDLIEALGECHYAIENERLVDDAWLNDKGLDRMYNVLMKNEVYVKLEGFFEENYSILKDCKSIQEFLWKLGEICPGGSEDCILKKCYEKKIPIFCPAISDSGIGLMMWGREVAGKGDNHVNVFSDLKNIIDISWTAKKKGIIYVGGGVPKNFIQQALQFSSPADYGVQITTDRVESGGSSGAPLKEGISWGKMNKEAKFVDVICDATIALPLIVAGLE